MRLCVSWSFTETDGFVLSSSKRSTQDLDRVYSLSEDMFSINNDIGWGFVMLRFKWQRGIVFPNQKSRNYNAGCLAGSIFICQAN